MASIVDQMEGEPLSDHDFTDDRDKITKTTSKMGVSNSDNNSSLTLQ